MKYSLCILLLSASVVFADDVFEATSVSQYYQPKSSADPKVNPRPAQVFHGVYRGNHTIGMIVSGKKVELLRLNTTLTTSRKDAFLSGEVVKLDTSGSIQLFESGMGPGARELVVYDDTGKLDRVINLVLRAEPCASANGASPRR